MKEKSLQKFFGKLATALFVALFVCLGSMFITNEVSEVQAAAGDVTESADFIAVEYNSTGMSGLIKESGNVAPEYEEGWIFAGWYQDAKCEEVFKDVKATSEKAFAKFVPEGVLSVKCQVNDDVTEDTPKTNMRLVSSVDSLNYLKVGFEIKYKDNAYKTIKQPVENNEVYKRIKANSTSGVEYEFSPKIVDTKSAYFITLTVLDINKNNYNEQFLVKAYWTTFDGTTVYGPSRYVTVADSYNEVVSIVVDADEVTSADNMATTGVEGATVSYRHFTQTKQEQKEANLILTYDSTGQRNVLTSLPSASRITVVDTANSDAEVASIIYRNTETSSNGAIGTEDRSWYEIYLGEDGKTLIDGADEFVIATNADLWGFARIVNDGERFLEKTVYLVSDVTVHEGSVDGNSVWTPNGTVQSWDKIGENSTNFFNGTFDGDGNTISGIYLDSTAGQDALFGFVGKAGTVKNFTLKDSYIVGGTKTSAISGTLYGTSENIYVSETVYVECAATSTVGGIVGYTCDADTTSIISNCWFAGTINTSLARCGGIVGRLYQGNCIVEDCLFTGKIVSTNASDAMVGGIVGSASDKKTSTLTIKNCLVDGTIEANSATKNVGAILGSTNTSYCTLDISDDVYASGTVSHTYADYAAGTSKNGTALVQADIKDYNAYFVTGMKNILLDENNDTWIARKNAVPALKMFVSHAESQECDLSWYYDHTSPYTIEDKEDLYGFMALVNSGKDAFSDKTVKLGRDIKLNEGSSREWAEGVDTDNLRQWVPIGKVDNGSCSFSGTFNGQGYTIRGLYVQENTERTGLFGCTQNGTVIKNLQLSESYIYQGTSGSNGVNTGSIVGLFRGNLNNVYCDNTVIVESEAASVGGMIGYFAGSSQIDVSVISNCWFAGKVDAADVRVGGIVGRIRDGRKVLRNCLNTGTIESQVVSNAKVGGLIGNVEVKANVTVENSLNNGSVVCDSTTMVGSILGVADKNATNPITVTFNNVYTINSSIAPLGSSSVVEGNTINGFPAELTTTELEEEQAYVNTVLDFYAADHTSGVWYATANGPELAQFSSVKEPIDDFSGYDKVKTDWYYNNLFNVTLVDSDENITYKMTASELTIMNADELYGLEKIVEDGVDDFTGIIVRLGQNITINNGTASSEGFITSTGESVRPWNGIGTSTKKFNGTFEGSDEEENIYSISGVAFVSRLSATGLFAYVGEGGCVQNLKLVNSYFLVGGNSGCVVGNMLGDLNNIYVDGSVYLDSNYNAVGGLVGYMDHSSAEDKDVNISNCWFAGTVNTSGDRCGGIVGRAYRGTNLTISNCLNTGNVIGNGNKTGGFIGSIGGGAGNNVTVSISNCLNAGTVTGTAWGDIVGAAEKSNDVTLTNVYAAIPNENALPTEDTTSGLLTDVTVYGAVNVMKESELSGEKAYTNTEFDFASSDNTHGIWRAIENDTPALAKFATTGINNLSLQRVNTGWYYNTKVNGQFPDETTFSIGTAADLYGLAKLVNNKTDYFSGDKVQLTKNIVVNEGKASLEKGWESTNGQEPTVWTPIGTDKTVTFAGTFDGNNKQIQGLYYYSTDTSKAGLFGTVNGNCKIQNVRIVNSYFEKNLTSVESAYMGSIVGDMYGSTSANNVYSNAILVTKGRMTGGLFGGIHNSAEFTLENCWFDGSIQSNTQYVGGIVGYLLHSVDMRNIAVTGYINSTYVGTANSVGGVVGYIDPGVDLVINSGVIAGKIIDMNSGTRATSVFGYMNNKVDANSKTVLSSTVTVENLFLSRDCCLNAFGSKTANADLKDENGTVIGTATCTVSGEPVWSLSTDRLMGYCVENSGESLDFADGTWILSEENVPVPATFVDVVTVVTDVAADAQLGLDTLNVSLKNAVHKGSGNYVLDVPATSDVYERYLQTLVSLDFEEYANNSSNISGVTSAADDSVFNVVYVKKNAVSDWVINITYTQNTSTMSISISTAGVESLSANLKYSATQIGTHKIEVAMLQMKKDNGELVKAHGIVITLPNGHFIVNDGGYNYNLDEVIAYMQESVGENNPIHVDAWFVSHIHSDHSGVFDQFRQDATMAKNLYVDGIYLSEPNKQTLAIDSVESSLVKYYKGMSKLCKNEKGDKTDIYRIQTGQRYYFNGIIMDVIQTQDQLSLIPNGEFDGVGTDVYLGHTFTEGQFNTTNTTVLFTMNSGEKMYVSGDATTVNDTYIKSAYGTNSQLLANIDIYVAPHHGLNMKQTYVEYLLANSDPFDVVLFTAPELYSLNNGNHVIDSTFNNKFSNNSVSAYTKSFYTYKNGNVVLIQGTDF